jgi:Xaa-Pro aminopeptidase
MRIGSMVLGFVVLAALPAAGWEKEPLSAYQERRARLVSATGGRGVIVLFGYNEADVAASTTAFRQNESFYYLTGWNQPDAILMLVPKVTTGSNSNPTAVIDKEVLFIPPHDYQEEKWTGPKLGAEDANAPVETGFATVKRVSLFPSELQEALKPFHRLYTELTPQPESGEDCFIKDATAKLHTLAPTAEIEDFRQALARMRMVKSPTEIALIRKAVDASVEAHLAAMRAVHPGMWEYEVAALMEYEFMRRECEWPSYPPIVGSGFYSTVLHYDSDDNLMHDGDVVVMDVAGSYSGYASDITRTLPVNGHFTAHQREIYDIVLGAQDAALAAAKPGVHVGGGKDSLNQIARDYIDSHGKDQHGNSLGQYFIHGLSHSVGLNVHDPVAYDQAPLEPGEIITVEPGIYIPEEKIGVRIEDMILITPDGAELLTRKLPRAADEVEKMMSRK